MAPRRGGLQRDYDAGRKRISFGWPKIEKCCELARDEGIPYAWVDTCCIDKTDPAELTESIHSVYAWYQQAAVCYAVLDDFEPPESLPYQRGCFDERDFR